MTFYGITDINAMSGLDINLLTHRNGLLVLKNAENCNGRKQIKCSYLIYCLNIDIFSISADIL